VCVCVCVTGPFVFLIKYSRTEVSFVTVNASRVEPLKSRSVGGVVVRVVIYRTLLLQLTGSLFVVIYSISLTLHGTANTIIVSMRHCLFSSY